MVDTFLPPTRDQLARVARGDERLIRAFEQLFQVAGTDIAGLQVQVDLNTAGIAANAARIKTNEVLLWLSM